MLFSNSQSKKIIIACVLALGIPFADAHAGNMDQTCDCFGAATSSLAIQDAFAEAQIACRCLERSFGPAHVPVDPPICPSGLIQVGALIKRNCTPRASTVFVQATNPALYEGVHLDNFSRNPTVQITCEIVRVCVTATGN